MLKNMAEGEKLQIYQQKTVSIGYLDAHKIKTNRPIGLKFSDNLDISIFYNLYFNHKAEIWTP